MGAPVGLVMAWRGGRRSIGHGCVGVKVRGNGWRSALVVTATHAGRRILPVAWKGNDDAVSANPRMRQDGEGFSRFGGWSGAAAERLLLVGAGTGRIPPDGAGRASYGNETRSPKTECRYKSENRSPNQAVAGSLSAPSREPLNHRRADGFRSSGFGFRPSVFGHSSQACKQGTAPAATPDLPAA